MLKSIQAQIKKKVNPPWRIKIALLTIGVALVAGASFLIFTKPTFLTTVYETSTVLGSVDATVAAKEDILEQQKEPSFVATHISTPEPMRAIYMTSWVAGTRDWRADLINFVESTELNAVVIDIKDYSGKISFNTDNELLNTLGASENRIPDIKEFIADLHKRGIYVIGRITVFQDPHLVSMRPDLALLKESDKSIWVDYKGLSYVDPGAQEVWDYIVTIARESWEVGFDELNFDYVRFPSDGNTQDIYFPFSEERVLADPDYGKAKVIRDFFMYLDHALSDIDATLSVDLFGMVTTNRDDLNIGQVLEYAEPYFDYIAPMVYPSHYPKWFIGYEYPATMPYEIVKYSMDRGVERLLAAGVSPLKLRPWLQDFDYGAVYDADMVRAQMQAVYDAGLTSWMIWDPKNIYTREAFDINQ